MNIPTGSPAPDFSLPDLSGANHTLTEFSGRILVLNIWSADCPWAERVDAALHKHLPAWGDAVQLAAVASNKNEKTSLLSRAAAKRGLPLVLHDPDQRLADLYGGKTTPHFFVIDREGILRYQGAYDDISFRQRMPSRTYLPEVISALLADRQPPFTETPVFGCTIIRFEDEG